MPTAEIIKTIDLPGGKRRTFVLVTFDAAERIAAADTTKPPEHARLPSLGDGSP